MIKQNNIITRLKLRSRILLNAFLAVVTQSYIYIIHVTSIQILFCNCKLKEDMIDISISPSMC